jgi:hypothetical protein
MHLSVACFVLIQDDLGKPIEVVPVTLPCYCRWKKCSLSLPIALQDTTG